MAASSGLFRNTSEQCGQPTQVVSPLASKMAASSGLFRNKSEQGGQPTQVGSPLATRGAPVAPRRSTVNKSATVTCPHSQRSVDSFRYLPVSGNSSVIIQLTQTHSAWVCFYSWKKISICCVSAMSFTSWSNVEQARLPCSVYEREGAILLQYQASINGLNRDAQRRKRQHRKT
jgi:hypothetical protein